MQDYKYRMLCYYEIVCRFSVANTSRYTCRNYSRIVNFSVSELVSKTMRTVVGSRCRLFLLFLNWVQVLLLLFYLLLSLRNATYHNNKAYTNNGCNPCSEPQRAHHCLHSVPCIIALPGFVRSPTSPADSHAMYMLCLHHLTTPDRCSHNTSM